MDGFVSWIYVEKVIRDYYSQKSKVQYTLETKLLFRNARFDSFLAGIGRNPVYGAYSHESTQTAHKPVSSVKQKTLLFYLVLIRMKS